MMLDGASPVDLAPGQAVLDGGTEPQYRIAVVGQATDGDEVPAALDAHPSDLVLTDLRMRRMDGITAIRRLRDRPNARMWWH
jgi:CheY-like chemotaxis protein